MSARAGSWRVGAVLLASLIGLAAAAAGGLLGYWQWQRAHEQGQPVTPAPPVPIAEATVPGGSATGMGQRVVAEGSWLDADAALVPDREVDGQAAVLLLVPFTVDAAATGTGEAAHLTVLAGWLPADADVTVPELAPTGVLNGYLRGSEAPLTGVDLPQGAPEGAFWVATMSTALTVQQWGPPTYSAIVVADQPAPGWNPMPVPEPERSLDIRSVTYAGEWWLFGAFGVFVAARWIRDNGRIAPAAPAEEE